MTIQEQLRDDVVVLRRRTKGLPDIERADRIASAADRIDELEAALRYVVQYERDMSPGYGLIPPWALAARNALEAS